MQSIQITKPGEINIQETSIPEINAEELLIKIKYVGFCGSDLSSYLGRNPMVNYPVIPGHEVAGTIEKTGKAVPDHLSAGQTVTVIPYTSCGECPSCRNGRSNACQFNQTLGVQRNGAMTEYIAIPWQKALVTQKLSMKELALTEPLTVGFHAASRGRITANDTVCVLGCGIIGIGAIIRSVDIGANVIAVDVDDSKLRLAEKLGAKFTINSVNENLDQRLKELTNHEGPDVIIEAAGQPSTYLAAIESVAFTGRVVCIGYAKEDIAFATKLFVQKEIDIMGSRNANSEDFIQVMEYLAKGKLQVEDLISMIVKPEKSWEAMKIWASNPGKIFKILVEFYDN
jgi:2-desacetyl-2-hydroxyethyl bacteriochlorophyllide A dehydrogenase